MLLLGLVVYLGAMFVLMLVLDARMRAAQAAREAAFLRRGFES